MTIHDCSCSWLLALSMLGLLILGCVCLAAALFSMHYDLEAQATDDDKTTRDIRRYMERRVARHSQDKLEGRG